MFTARSGSRPSLKPVRVNRWKLSAVRSPATPQPRAMSCPKSACSWKRGKHHARMSKAKYEVKGQPNISALALTLKVYDFRMANPHLKLWEIGDQLPRFMVGNKIAASDAHTEVINKRNVLSASVARYIKKAQLMIFQTAIGQLF